MNIIWIFNFLSKVLYAGATINFFIFLWKRKERIKTYQTLILFLMNGVSLASFYVYRENGQESIFLHNDRILYITSLIMITCLFVVLGQLLYSKCEKREADKELSLDIYDFHYGIYYLISFFVPYVLQFMIAKNYLLFYKFFPFNFLIDLANFAYCFYILSLLLYLVFRNILALMDQIVKGIQYGKGQLSKKHSFQKISKILFFMILLTLVSFYLYYLYSVASLSVLTACMYVILLLVSLGVFYFFFVKKIYLIFLRLNQLPKNKWIEKLIIVSCTISILILLACNKTSQGITSKASVSFLELLATCVIFPLTIYGATQKKND